MGINDGGPAFPIHGAVADYQYAGMSLRDYFATAELSKVEGTFINDIPEAYERCAQHCFKMADAMIRAREVKS